MGHLLPLHHYGVATISVHFLQPPRRGHRTLEGRLRVAAAKRPPVAVRIGDLEMVQKGVRLDDVAVTQGGHSRESAIVSLKDKGKATFRNGEVEYIMLRVVAFCLGNGSVVVLHAVIQSVVVRADVLESRALQSFVALIGTPHDGAGDT